MSAPLGAELWYERKPDWYRGIPAEATSADPAVSYAQAIWEDDAGLVWIVFKVAAKAATLAVAGPLRHLLQLGGTGSSGIPPSAKSIHRVVAAGGTVPRDRGVTRTCLLPGSLRPRD